MHEEFIPVKKVLNIINSCETENQLESCNKLIENYVEQMEQKGLTNSDTLKLRLLKEFKQKKFQINMLKLFIKRHRAEFERTFPEKNLKIIA